jgi:hypothetical protein
MIDDSQPKTGARMNKTLVAAAILVTVSASTTIRVHGEQAASAKPAALDPCTLLTKPDAAAAVGEAVEQKAIRPGGSMPGVEVNACDYEAASRSHVQLTLWRPYGDSAGMFLQIYKSKCEKKERLPGLGDLACWYSKDHRELQVLKGSNLLMFQISRSGDATEALTMIAKKAVARLP